MSCLGFDFWAQGQALSVSFTEIFFHCFVRNMKEINMSACLMKCFFPIDDLENHVY